MPDSYPVAWEAHGDATPEGNARDDIVDKRGEAWEGKDERFHERAFECAVRDAGEEERGGDNTTLTAEVESVLESLSNAIAVKPQIQLKLKIKWQNNETRIKDVGSFPDQG